MVDIPRFRLPILLPGCVNFSDTFNIFDSSFLTEDNHIYLARLSAMLNELM